MVRLEQETDIEILRQAAKLLESENRRLVAKIAELTRELVVPLCFHLSTRSRHT